MTAIFKKPRQSVASTETLMNSTDGFDQSYLDASVGSQSQEDTCKEMP